MNIKKMVSLILISLLIGSTGLVLSGCKCKVKEDQLARLAELRRQERALNSEISDVQNTRPRLDRELQTRSSEYNDCDGKREIVKQRLSVWPNIWPDYSPEQ